MHDIPEDAIQAAAEVLFRDYESQYSADHLTWRDFAGDARKILEAAAPAMAAQHAEAVRLLEEALHLRANGEYAPGGSESWVDWDRKTETYLRSLLR